MDPETPVELIKKDEEIASVGMRRSRNGILFTVIGHSTVEGLFQEWGSGERQSVKVHGAHWRSLRDHKPLEVWQMDKLPPNSLQTAGGIYCSLDKPGHEILIVDANGRQQLNLSFLRLCGISEGSKGVSFVVAGVYSTEVIETLAKLIPAAIERFHLTYLMPVSIEMRVFSTIEHL